MGEGVLVHGDGEANPHTSLSFFFVQLHISEKSGRGVPKIVSEYGKGAFEFTDSSIIVTLPYQRLKVEDNDNPQVNLGNPQDNLGNPQVDKKDGIVRKEKSPEIIKEKIIAFCSAEPKGLMDIAKHIGYKDRKTIHKYLDPLIIQGRIAMTVPEKPNSRNQKYISIG